MPIAMAVARAELIRIAMPHLSRARIGVQFALAASGGWISGEKRALGAQHNPSFPRLTTTTPTTTEIQQQPPKAAPRSPGQPGVYLWTRRAIRPDWVEVEVELEPVKLG